MSELPLASGTARILAVDSATVQCSVALLAGGELLQRIAPAGARNSEVMLPMVRALLAEAGLPLASLDVIAFGAGPGAFTGLRVACGVAQGLALGAGLGVIAVGTLEVLAETVCPWSPAAGDQQVLAALDARMQECYWGELQRDGADWRLGTGPLLCAPDAVPLPKAGNWLGVGDAFTVFAAALRSRLGDRCVLAPGHGRQPEAAALARLAAVRWARGAAVPPEQAQPLYVRDKVALTSQERAAR